MTLMGYVFIVKYNEIDDVREYYAHKTKNIEKNLSITIVFFTQCHS